MVLASLLYAALTNSKTAAAAKKKAEAYANATGPLPKLCRDCTTSIHMGCHAAKHGFFHRIFNCLMPMIALLPAVEENDQACLYGMGGGGGVLDFVRPILSDVISTSHSWRTIMCSRCSGDAGMCSHRSNFSGVPRQFAMESGWNYTSLSSGNFMATSGNATEGPQALLRRYLGRRAWPFFADPRMERRAVVLIVRKGGGRVFAPGVEQQLLQVPPPPWVEPAGLASPRTAPRGPRAFGSRGPGPACASWSAGSAAWRVPSAVRLGQPPRRATALFCAAAQALQQATGREVYVYRGNESTAQTVDVFANARAVVGYHGAGFANTMMSTHGACVMEASTNANVYGTVPWRTNAFMCLPWNPGLRWAIYRVPLTHMLDANHVRCTAAALRAALGRASPEATRPYAHLLRGARGHAPARPTHPGHCAWAPPRRPSPPGTPTAPTGRRPTRTSSSRRWRSCRCDPRRCKRRPPHPFAWLLHPLILAIPACQVHAMAAATQSCLGPLERGLPWPLLERANESQRVVLPGMEDTGIAYLDRVDLHTLRHAAARHGAANRQPSIDEQLHWNIDEQLH